MKLIIFSFLFTVLSILVSFTNCLKMQSSMKTESKTKFKAANRSKFELTFSSENSIPENVKRMESIFSSRPVKVESKFSFEGEQSHSLMNNNLVFSNSNKNNNSLRFKQSDSDSNDSLNSQIKNFEVPEIRRPKPTNEIVHGSLPVYEQQFRDVDRLMSFEEKLLDQFKNVLENTLHPKETEIVNISHVTVNNFPSKTQ